MANQNQKNRQAREVTEVVEVMITEESKNLDMNLLPTPDDYALAAEMFPSLKSPEDFPEKSKAAKAAGLLNSADGQLLKRRANILVVGSTVVDLTFYTPHLPSVGQTVAGRFQQGLGGKGFNQAIAAARSGEKVRFLSAMGNEKMDPYAKGFLKRLEEMGIENRIFLSSKTATGAASIAVSQSGENQIIVSLGANEELKPEFLNQHEEFFENVDVMLAQFEVPLPTILHAVVRVKEKNPQAKIILNPAPALNDIPGELLRRVDYFTPNETELEVVSGIKVTDEISANTACKKLVQEWKNDCPRKFIITLGEKGILVFDSHSLSSYLLPAIKVIPKDTSGAGDAFNGSFAGALCKSYRNETHALEYAIAYAGLSVTKEGTSSSMPLHEEVMEWWLGNLATQNEKPSAKPSVKSLAKFSADLAWWRPISGLAPDWERLPQAALFGDVVISKRNELGLLSNFAATPFELDGKKYPSVEGFWQMMFYPDPEWEGGVLADPRSQENLRWPYQREEVSNLVGHEAFAAGVVGFANMRRLGMNSVTYRGKSMPYWVFEKGEHYALIVRALTAKRDQNPEVAKVLQATRGLRLIADHFEPEKVPPSWKYTDIWMMLRDGF